MLNNDSEKKSSGTEYGTSQGLFGETNRDNGEYVFRSGRTQQVYSNANYIPAGEDTQPLQYYTPPVKPETAKKETEQKKKEGRKKTGYGFFAVLLLCLACALLGGVTGAAIMTSYFTQRVSSVEQQVQSLSAQTQQVEENPETEQLMSDFAGEENVLSETDVTELTAAEIYDIACAQVVSLNTEYEVQYNNAYSVPSSVSGSGFIVSEDGYILTNYHVISPAAEGGYTVNVTLHDASVYDGQVVGYDQNADIAILKINATNLSPVSFANSDDVAVGDTIYAVGNPFGMLEYTLSAGHVSALNRIVATESNENGSRMFQIDADIYEGNSGGPVYNSKGKVVGIVTARYTTNSELEGIGFAIPVNDAMETLNNVLETGYSIPLKASLGIVIDERYNTVFSNYYRLPSGAYIHSVESGSCAETAGIREGDVITKIGSSDVTDYSAVSTILKQYSAGDTAELMVFRDNCMVSVLVTFDGNESSDGVSYYSPTSEIRNP